MIKQILKALGYILGGLICSALIVGAATLIVLGIALVIGWLLSFPTIALITQWIMNIVLGVSVFIMGIVMFMEIIEWAKNKRISKE